MKRNVQAAMALVVAACFASSGYAQETNQRSSGDVFQTSAVAGALDADLNADLNSGLASPGCTSGCCTVPCCSTGCGCTPPIHRTGAFASFLYLQARGANYAFGVPQNGLTGLVGTAPNGSVGVADPRYSQGFRIGYNQALDCSTSLRVTYQWWDSNVNNTLAVAGPAAANVIRPMAILPGTVNAGAIAQQAASSYGIGFQTIDADYRVSWANCVNYNLDLVFGVRYAHLDQDLFAGYNFAPPTGPTAVFSNINFDGAGLRFGLDGQRRVHCGLPLEFYGRGFANFLAGEYRANYRQVNAVAGQQGALAWQDDRITTILEAELGVAWVSSNNRVRVSAGYYMAAWFNTVTTPGWIQTAQTLNFASVSNTLTFDGLVARVGYSY